MSEFEAIEVSSDAREWHFLFDNDGQGTQSGRSCAIDLDLPEPYGRKTIECKLTGSYSALVEPNGTLFLSDFTAELAAFDVMLPAKGHGEYPYSVGRLNFVLDRRPVDMPMGGRWLAPNTGYVDLESGFTQLMWSVYAHSPELHSLGWDPLRVLVAEAGHLDFPTMQWRCDGVGLITTGELDGTRLRVRNGMVATPWISLRVPPTMLGNAENRFTIKYERTSNPHEPVVPDAETFDLSAWVTGMARGGVRINPSSVRLAAGDEAEVTVETTGLLPGNRVQITVVGAGETAVADTTVVGG